VAELLELLGLVVVEAGQLQVLTVLMLLQTQEVAVEEQDIAQVILAMAALAAQV
jgi:hypothetical protein